MLSTLPVVFLLTAEGWAAQEGEPAAPAAVATATFAGGCFWCMQPPFEKTPGVVSVVVGYAGGTKENPAYEEVSAGGTGHAESIQVAFDPSRVSYERLLEVFWRNVDPTRDDGQFCDSGPQYRPVIFYHDAKQHELAEKSVKEAASRLQVRAPIKVELAPAGPFWRAEEYHQDYHRKNPIRYNFYRLSCGRDKRLRQVWGP